MNYEYRQLAYYPLHADCIGEGLRLAKDRMSEKNNIYFTNPSFDR